MRIISKKKIPDTGFTLVELLVVISIIGLLSSVVLTSLSAVKVKANNSYTIQTISEYVKAFQSYYLDKGYFPTITTPNWQTSYCLGGASTCAYANNPPLPPTILSDYFTTLPKPVNYKTDNVTSFGLTIGSFYQCSAATLDSNNKCPSAKLYWERYSTQPCGIPGSSPVSNIGTYYCFLDIPTN